MVWSYFITFHTSPITDIRAMFFINQYVIYLFTHFLSGDLQVTFRMFLFWYHVTVTAKPLTRAKFTILFPLSFVLLWRLCPPHAGYKWDSFPTLMSSPLLLFSCRNREMHHVPSPKKYKILLWLLQLFLQLGVCLYQCQILLFKFNPNFTNSFMCRLKI